MKKLKTVIMCLIMAALIAAAFPVVSFAEAGGLGDGDCPSGYSLVARYNWPEGGPAYAFDSGSTYDIITFSPNADGLGPNALVGHWDSGTWPIHVVVLTDGWLDGNRVRDYTYYLPDGATEDDFGPLLDANDKQRGISHIDFCSLETAVTLVSFAALENAGNVTLSWHTSVETDNAGFNLYRAASTNGPWTKINETLIAAQGDPVSGATYSFVDAPGYGTFFYQLEDVNYYGATALHGPAQAKVSAPFRRPLHRPTLPGY